MNNKKNVTVVGAGLAGSECAWQLANLNYNVTLYEMRPSLNTQAHKTANFAELVCSNSFRSDNKETSAIGLLHDELRKLKSIILQTADKYKVPAGDALAVDRIAFSENVTKSLSSHKNITLVNQEFSDLSDFIADDSNTLVLATGPLTSPNLSEKIKTIIGDNSLNFFDAISPIIYKDSIDFNHAWFQSRYDKGSGKDYINCPLTEEQYNAFYNELINAEYVEFEDWEKDIPFFEGCLPIEVMASRGKQTLLFGPMKPVGLSNPHTTDKPYAVIQLRQDNLQGTMYNIVGFQTKLKYAEQKRIFRMIPALANAEFAKLGSIHKNTFINSPVLLNNNLSLKSHPNIFFAGQISGCEGYVESTSLGLASAYFIHSKTQNIELKFPDTTAIGSMINHVTIGNLSRNYQPMNINLGLFPELEKEDLINPNVKKLKKADKRTIIINKAIKHLDTFIDSLNNQNFYNDLD